MESNVTESTTSPLRSGHAEEAATSLRSRRQVVYDVWLMTGLKDNRRIASKASLREAHEVITPEHRKEYVYILKWTPMPKQPTSSLLRSRQAVYTWGCLCNRVHTNDLRPSVRAILRG